MTNHIFNDDLLTNPGDLENARALFPEIIHVLDHPDLRGDFLKFDRKANKARAKTRFLGFTAICGAVIALLGAVTEVLWEHSGWEMWVSIILETTAIFAAMLAGGELLVGSSKQDWLESRLMTERLRQWHFQLLVARMHEIELSCDKTNPKAVEEFETKRSGWFEIFRNEYGEGKLDALLVDFSKRGKSAEDWLHPGASASLANGSLLATIHQAYRVLRFKHQHMYANHVLRDSSDHAFFHFLRWPLLRQARLLDTMISACVVIAFISSIVIIVWRVLSATEHHAAAPGLAEHGLVIGSACAMLILTCTIIGVALRTLQEGLCISSDIERYREYRGEVDSLKSAFDKINDPKTRHELMVDMENAVVKEMREFLHSHKEARFVF